MKKVISLRFICIIILMLCIIMLVTSLSINASEEFENINNIANEHLNGCCFMSGICANLDTEQRCFSPNDKISVTYTVSSNISIEKYDYTYAELSISSITIDEYDNSIIRIVAVPSQHSLESKLEISLFLNNGEKIVASLYVFSNEYGSFISPFSYDDAREYYYDFAISNGILTEGECDEIRNSFVRKGTIAISDVNIENVFSNNSLNYRSTDSNIYIGGCLKWVDDNGIEHPLRHVKVEIRDKDEIGSSVVKTVYTSDYGYFSCTFDNSDGALETNGADIFFRIYPGDDDIVIKTSKNNIYYWEPDKLYENVTSGNLLTLFESIDMTTDCGRAFQISQALVTARDYAKVMCGDLWCDVTVKYPMEGVCCYYDSTDTIHISGNARSEDNLPHSYASWDTIMHEYGHHVQYEMNIIEYPDVDGHGSSINHADNLNNKLDGIHLAWAESWPTVFGLIAQQYYNTLLTNIDTVGDTSYESYSGVLYNIETTTVRLGEACERSIMAVLWDIYDSNNDGYSNDVDNNDDISNHDDSITLGNQSFWYDTTESQSKTFSDFIEHFYQKYPYYVENLGPILSYYQMATSKPVITNASSVSQTTPPTFSWSVQGGSEHYPNNRFVLIVYSVTGTELYRTQTLTSNADADTDTDTYTYTLTANQWNTILNSYGQTYSVAIAAVQTGNPTTGEYISERNVAIAKPPTQNLTLSMTLGNTAKFSERIVELKAGQCIDYRITFNVGGQKLLQTFGSKDTKMALYDSNGNLLASDDDSGYGLNSLISYYFNANVEYIVRVHFYSSSQVGKIKFTVTPARGALNSGASSIQKYEDIYSVKSYTGYTWSTYLEPNYTKAITFTPPSSGDYTFEITSNLDTYIYVIDPRSTEWIIVDVNYNDDAGEDNNAKLTTALEANVPYLVIYSTYNFTSLSQSTYITLNISKN